MSADHSIMQVFAKARLPVIGSMGRMAFDPFWAKTPHPANAAEIIHVLDGQLHLEAEGKTTTAYAGDTLVIPSGLVHRDVFDLDRGMEVFHGSFVWEAEQDYFEQVSFQDLPGIAFPDKSAAARVVARMDTDLADMSSIDPLIAGARLLTILLILLRGCMRTREGSTASEGYSRRHDLMVRARQYMDEHYSETLSLESIASALHVSGYYLSHVFSEESDTSLFVYLTRLRLQKAASMLAKGDMQVSQAAAAVGYTDANYFAKVFRKHYDCSPSEYVERHRSAS